jgi:hypothetical protein
VLGNHYGIEDTEFRGGSQWFHFSLILAKDIPPSKYPEPEKTSKFPEGSE